MESIDFSKNEFETLKQIVQMDIADLAESPDFFEGYEKTPKEYIDERISICKHFGIDFWNYVNLSCSHFVLERLKALYHGTTIKEFLDNYQAPSQSELEKEFLKGLIHKKVN